MNGSTHARRASDMLIGAALLLAGVVAGGILFSDKQPQAFAQLRSGGPVSSPGLPAITLGENELALVKGNGNYYFLVNRSGQAEAVRFRDNTLRTVPSESLLFVQ